MVAVRRAGLPASIATHQAEMERRERIVLFVDEWFLLWGNAHGHVWGLQGKRSYLPVGSSRARQVWCSGCAERASISSALCCGICAVSTTD